jgi:hypothetical protein
MTMTNKNLALVGSALLAGGLFSPIVTMPILGSVNIFNNGTNVIAILLLALAAIAAGLAAKARLQDVIWPGLAACGVLLFIFGDLQFRISAMRSSVKEELEGNPFAGIAQSAIGAIQLQWGWIILGVGAGLLIYAGLGHRKETDTPSFRVGDRKGRLVALLSAILFLAAPAWSLLTRSPAKPALASSAPTVSNDELGEPVPGATTDNGPTAEEASYIKQHLRLYDLEARYFDSMLDGSVPGVDFKIQNSGNRTLNGVTVRVVFYDASGKPIAEEEYNPVIVSEYSFGTDNAPLRPNYIWQQERDKFYQAKNVPSEWASGKASATISDIEFAPNG